jgi:hypothetical protein
LDYQSDQSGRKNYNLVNFGRQQNPSQSIRYMPLIENQLKCWNLQRILCQPSMVPYASLVRMVHLRCPKFEDSKRWRGNMLMSKNIDAPAHVGSFQFNWLVFTWYAFHSSNIMGNYLVGLVFSMDCLVTCLCALQENRVSSSVPRNITEQYSSIPKPRKIPSTDEHRPIYMLQYMLTFLSHRIICKRIDANCSLHSGVF